MKIVLLFLSIMVSNISDTSIYDYTINDVDGNVINLNAFQGKKLLFVNTASDSKYAAQYASLEHLYQTYKDSLVIIAVPSNDFGNEPLSSDSLKSFVIDHYDIHYILGSKTSVTGTDIIPVYHWLTDVSLNHVYNNSVNGDFYKFLVDETGNIIGLYSGSVDPMDSTLQNQIKNQ
jgi:glutathione peroxidase